MADCALVLIIALVTGYRATIGLPWVVLSGLIVGEVGAAVYFGVANWLGGEMPGMLDARLVGLYFLVLVFACGVCGAGGAWFGHRKSMGMSLF